nr:MAG TPA: hypothetical protein [Caudoviricetes sp.]
MFLLLSILGAVRGNCGKMLFRAINIVLWAAIRSLKWYCC